MQPTAILCTISIPFTCIEACFMAQVRLPSMVTKELAPFHQQTGPLISSSPGRNHHSHVKPHPEPPFPPVGPTTQHPAGMRLRHICLPACLPGSALQARDIPFPARSTVQVPGDLWKAQKRPPLPALGHFCPWSPKPEIHLAL